MRHLGGTAFLAALAVGHWAIVANGQDGSKTHEVKAENFEIEVEVSGVLAAEESAEISVEPKSWSQFKVLEAVAHGAKVSEGQVLVRFDDKELNESLEDMQTDQQLAELAIIQSEEELPRLEQSLNMQYESADRALKIAQEEFQRWQEIDRPLSIKSAEYSLKSARQYLENQQEELEQLEKMYEADDLTEETEEIILKRQRNAVESAQFYYEQSKIRHDEIIEVLLPRSDVTVRLAVERAELDLARAKSSLALSTNQQQFLLQKAKHQRKRSLQRHADLLADRELLTVKSPRAGVVFYGRSVNGKWSGAQSLIESLQPGGSISPKSVFMTVVQLRPLVVLATLQEKDVVNVSAGAGAKVIPTADAETEIPAKVVESSGIPVGDGQFPLKAELTNEAPQWLVPGMTCKIKITTYTQEDALTVPTAAVRTDENDKDQKYVLLQTAEGKEPERRDVKIGKAHGGKSVVTEGLQAGDVVVLGEVKSQSKDEAAEKAQDSQSEEESESEATDE